MRKPGPRHVDLERYLQQLAGQARPGDRLPPIREFMRRFGVSQAVVQAALEGLRERGLIDSQVGRGTFFVRGGDGSAPADPARTVARGGSAVRSVLLLRRSISIVRGRVLVDELRGRFMQDGHRVLEVSYTDPEHARTVLQALPHFDACVVQSTYKTITIELLAALREKCWRSTARRWSVPTWSRSAPNGAVRWRQRCRGCGARVMSGSPTPRPRTRSWQPSWAGIDSSG